MIVKALLNAVITVTIPRLANYLGTGDYEGYNTLINYLRKFLYALVLPSIVGVYFWLPILCYYWEEKITFPVMNLSEFYV